MRKALVTALAVPFLLCGCPLGQQAPAARAQEAASDFNLNTRFGRMELAAEQVSAKGRDGFLQRRRAWGGKIRVADYELQGLKMKGDDDADVYVKVAWTRVDEGDLRVTTLQQRWHSYKGDWKLDDEKRVDGDVGLLGEAVPASAAPAAPRNAQFPTIRLGAGAMPNEELPPQASAPAGR
jgi:hypothetical protein